MDDNYKKILLEKHPYLAYLTYAKSDYICIIQNIDDTVTTIYDFGAIRTDESRLIFLELAETWWWESNRKIPINLFLKHDWDQFKSTLKTLNTKDVEVKIGPMLSLKEMALSKSKRRSITLVRRVQ